VSVNTTLARLRKAARFIDETFRMTDCARNRAGEPSQPVVQRGVYASAEASSRTPRGSKIAARRVRVTDASRTLAQTRTCR